MRMYLSFLKSLLIAVICVSVFRMVSFKDQIELEPRPGWSPSRVYFKFSDDNLHPLTWEFPMEHYMFIKYLFVKLIFTQRFSVIQSFNTLNSFKVKSPLIFSQFFIIANFWKFNATNKFIRLPKTYSRVLRTYRHTEELCGYIDHRKNV